MTKKLKSQERRCKQSLKNETSFLKRNHTVRILQAKENSSKISKPWTIEEDKILANLINFHKMKNFSEISKKLPGRSSTQCRFRWAKIKSGLKKGQWSLQEDKLLKEWVKENGPRKWEQCGLFIHGRSGKQCREHWSNCLNPDLIKGEWTSEEDFLIMQFYEKCNGSWKKIIHLFNGRTENSIKNRFFSQLRKYATKGMNISERKFCAKIKLEELKKYLGEAVSEAKNAFLSDNPMTQEEFNNYLNKMKLKFMKKTVEDIDNNDTMLSTNLGDSKGENTENSLTEKKKGTSEESFIYNSGDSFEENKIKIENDEVAFDYRYTNNNYYDNDENNDINKSNMLKNNYYLNNETTPNQICEINNYNYMSFNNDEINNDEYDLKNSFFRSLNFSPINPLEDLYDRYKSSYDFNIEENNITGNNSIKNSEIEFV